ncbi:MAG: cytidine deaminase [Bacillota bacterium]
MSEGELIALALLAKRNAYSPYSGFRVGAALLCADGRVFTGCNVENASFSVTTCAERVALFSAVAQGARKFSAIAVVTDSEQPVFPCGVCRQALAEFSPDMNVIAAGLKEVQTVVLGQLLPHAFSHAHIGGSCEHGR